MESTKNENILINCARTTFPMEKNAMRWANYIEIDSSQYFYQFSLISKYQIHFRTKVFSRKFFKLETKWELGFQV